MLENIKNILIKKRKLFKMKLLTMKVIKYMIKKISITYDSLSIVHYQNNLHKMSKQKERYSFH